MGNEKIQHDMKWSLYTLTLLRIVLDINKRNIAMFYNILVVCIMYILYNVNVLEYL